jgi:hypothetical protein
LAKSSKSVLFLSDLHVGSAYAICSKEPTIGDTGGSWRPNKLQKKLYETWMWVKDSLSQKPHVLCLNGEGIDGANTKQQGQQSWTPDINDQIADCCKLLREIKYTNFVVTRGSGYHVQKDATNYDELLAREMKATPYRGFFQDYKDYDTNRNAITRTDYWVDFRIHGIVFNVTHHIAFSKWASYQPMAISRELANMEFLKGKYWKPEDFPSVVVRSHVHYYCRVEFPRYTAFTTPCLKMPDAHLYRGGMAGTAPSLGAVEVIVESNGKIIVEPHIVSNTEYPKHSILEF